VLLQVGASHRLLGSTCYIGALLVSPGLLTRPLHDLQARNVTTGAAINANNTPLIAWFNGGPGCSSLWGMFFENGPYTLNASLALLPNPNTWAGIGHMLYIDQPIGTGLSYSAVRWACWEVRIGANTAGCCVKLIQQAHGQHCLP
jgi:hypothetical protein